MTSRGEAYGRSRLDMEGRVFAHMYERLNTLRFPLELLLSVVVAPTLWRELTKAVSVCDFFTMASILLFIGVSGYLVYASRPKVHVPELPDTCNFRFEKGDVRAERA